MTNQDQPAAIALRDYLAAHALTGLLANSEYKYADLQVASEAYRHADNMLKARQDNKQ